MQKNIRKTLFSSKEYKKIRKRPKEVDYYEKRSYRVNICSIFTRVFRSNKVISYDYSSSFNKREELFKKVLDHLKNDIYTNVNPKIVKLREFEDGVSYTFPHKRTPEIQQADRPLSSRSTYINKIEDNRGCFSECYNRNKSLAKSGMVRSEKFRKLSPISPIAQFRTMSKFL